MQQPKSIGVILMTYGSPSSLEEIPTYLKHIYSGKDPSLSTIKEFRRRYSLIGASPLIRITQEQAIALQKELTNQFKNDLLFQVGAGMRFSHPFITEVIPQLAENKQQIIGIIMSPQFSPIIMRGYQQALSQSISQLSSNKLLFEIAENWYTEPLFLQALAKKTREVIMQLPRDIQKNVPIVFTAHSMPKRVIEKEPGYIVSLQETASEVAKLLHLTRDRWTFCYQSAGHTPEEWLKPDFVDIMPQLRKNGFNHVIIAPIQFLADHLEILYDIEIAARKQAEDQGIHFLRTPSLNTSPLFIKALAEVVKKYIL